MVDAMATRAQLDGAELAVIVGASATGAVDEPLEHIFGHTLFTDFSAQVHGIGELTNPGVVE
jgi:hypothetical protein